MSTKITIAWGNKKNKDFHLYRECFEEDGSVYLEIKHPEYFNAEPDCVVVKIPKKIFGEILKVKDEVKK